jgi:single-strand DNA-binding protein
MGVALWEALLANPATPATLIDELYAIELQRIVLNMQISLTHSIARQALECASKAAEAEAATCGASTGIPRAVPPTNQGVTHEHALRRRRQHRFCAGLPRVSQRQRRTAPLLRLNVYFDNPIPKKDGDYEDRGGFWAPVEMWHRDAEHWKTLYQKGMRVLVEGRMEREPWRTTRISRARPGRSTRAASASCRSASSPWRSAPSRRPHRTRSPSPRPPRNRQRRRSPSAGSDPAGGGRSTLPPPMPRELSPGDSSISVHRLPARSRNAAPGSHTSGRTPPCPSRLHHVKAVAAACGLFAAAPTGARHPRSPATP